MRPFMTPAHCAIPSRRKAMNWSHRDPLGLAPKSIGSNPVTIWKICASTRVVGVGGPLAVARVVVERETVVVGLDAPQPGVARGEFGAVFADDALHAGIIRLTNTCPLMSPMSVFP
jgi:hypothetical protein